MITIPEYIRDALKAEYPKKAESVNNGLSKYLNELNSYIVKSINSTTGVYQYMHFNVPVDTLKRNSMRMGGAKTYIHDWLKNNYPLFDVIEEGNNLTHKLSVIRLTNLATYQDPIVKYPKFTEYLEYTKLPTYDLDDMLDHDKHVEIFNSLYPELKDNIDFSNPLFDFSPIDTVSLRGFIEWLVTATKIEPKKKQDMYRQARIINSVAKVTNGYLPQYKNSSLFGRTYYRGLSMQSTYKALRYAALGEAYQYDIRSSAITWKMKFAKDIPDRNWSSTILFLEDKKGFVLDVYNEVFRGYKMFNTNTNQSFEISKEDATRKIKDVLNAITFGAKITVGGVWYNEKGHKVTTAINDIIPDKELRKKFLDFYHIKRFIEDQKILDDFIFNKYKDTPRILAVKDLFEKNGKINRSKFNAYLYQQSETNIMTAVHMLVEKLDKRITAKIHDAVILDSKLSFNEKQEIESIIRERFQIPLWTLTLDIHNPYTYISSESKETILEHTRRIVQEERLARNYPLTRSFDVAHVPTMEEMAYAFFEEELKEAKQYR